MYGNYDFPFSVEKEGISVSMEKSEKLWMYKRTFGADDVEIRITGDEKHITINPVEPLNTPKKITPNLMIEFEKSLLLAGETIKTIFLTFPIEIGVFISDKGNKNLHLLDVFTQARQKFTLYGSVSNGIICKHWKSAVYSTSPSSNPIQEGVIELTLRNNTSDWVSISKAIFDAYGMKLYYDASVFMKAHMDILNKNTAETSFDLHHIGGGVKSFYLENPNTRKEAIEVYNRKLVIVPLKFEMGLGL
jgi:uncharacterized protein